MKLVTTPDGMPLDEALESAFGAAAGSKLYQKIIDRVGQEPVEELGHGMFGVAYRLPDGRVLKVTSDNAELSAMTLMTDIKHPNLVRVHDTFVVKSGQRGVGVIVKDFVQQILDKIPAADEMNSALRNAVDNSEEMYDSWRFQRQRDKVTSIKKAMEFLHRQLVDDSSIWPELKQIADGVSALLAAGIYSIDIEPTNVGVNDGYRFVIFDVGNGEVEREVAVAVQRNPPIEVL